MDEVKIRWQQCRAGYDITNQMYSEDDADEVRAWEGAHGDTLILALNRTPRGKWAIDSTDTLHLPRYMWDRRFTSPADALAQIAKLRDIKFTEAVCRCGTPEDCD